MRRGATDAETCRLNGWGVGTVLAGDEGYGVSEIVLTAIGEDNILARKISHAGESVDETEHSWTLIAREWNKVRERKA